MQDSVIVARSRRRMPRRPRLRSCKRGIFLSFAAQIHSPGRQCRYGSSSARFFGLRILRAFGECDCGRSERTLRSSYHPFGRRMRHGLLFVENHRKTSKRQGRLRCPRYIQKRRKDLCETQSKSGMRRCKRIRYARCKRIRRRGYLRVFALCDGRIRASAQRRRDTAFGFSVREPSHRASPRAVQGRTQCGNRPSEQHAHAFGAKRNHLYVPSRLLRADIRPSYDDAVRLSRAEIVRRGDEAQNFAFAHRKFLPMHAQKNKSLTNVLCLYIIQFVIKI